MSTLDTPPARLLATMTVRAELGAIRIDDRLDAAIDDVWSALTDRTRLADWLGDVTGPLELGGTHRIHYHASGAEGLGTVSACNEPNELAITTTDIDGQNERHLSVRLTADGDGTSLQVDQDGLPVEWLAAFAAGYQVHVEDLAAHLDGRPRCDSDARMDVLCPLYDQQPVTSEDASA